MNFSVPKIPSSNGYLRSKDQTPLFYRHYAVEGQKATVLVVHGFGEHSGRYGHIVEQLLKRGFEVYCLDFRGHGQSQGKRGDVKQFCCFEEDLLAAVKFINERQRPEQKLFILAHSMGALVTLRLMAHIGGEGVDGMVLSAPLIALSMSIPAWKKKGASFLAKLLPTLSFPSGIKGEQLSSDIRVGKAYENDPLVNRKISVRAFEQIEASVKEISNLGIKKPFFMQIAGRDSIVDSSAAVRWFNSNKHNDAQIKIYDDFLHEIYNETKQQEPIDDALAWLEAHSKLTNC